MLDNSNANSRQWLIPTKDFVSEANTSTESIKRVFAPAKKKHIEKAEVMAPKYLHTSEPKLEAKSVVNSPEGSKKKLKEIRANTDLDEIDVETRKDDYLNRAASDSEIKKVTRKRLDSSLPKLQKVPKPKVVNMALEVDHKPKAHFNSRK